MHELNKQLITSIGRKIHIISNYYRGNLTVEHLEPNYYASIISALVCFVTIICYTRFTVKYLSSKRIGRIYTVYTFLFPLNIIVITFILFYINLFKPTNEDVYESIIFLSALVLVILIFLWTLIKITSICGLFSMVFFIFYLPVFYASFYRIELRSDFLLFNTLYLFIFTMFTLYDCTQMVNSLELSTPCCFRDCFMLIYFSLSLFFDSTFLYIFVLCAICCEEVYIECYCRKYKIHKPFTVTKTYNIYDEEIKSKFDL